MPGDASSPRLRRWLANAVILALLLMVLCDAMPIAPDECQAVVVPIVNRLGIGQGRWTMFSPPDGDNHRLRAELTLRDGRLLDWRSPDLTRQSVWQRFIGHRRSEYIDNAITFGKQHPETWDVFADRLKREYELQGHDVVRIRVIVALANLPPPSGTLWPSRMKEVPFDDQRVVVRRKYP